MKLEWAKKIQTRFLVAAVGLGICLVPAVAGATNPYFKTFGSDVMAGGWFASGASCSTSSPPYQSYPSIPDQRSGGILTYFDSGKGGASSQYGAFALGQIETNSSSKFGFYSAGDVGSPKTLTFANTSASGGFFEGSTPQSNCIPDYYNQKIGETSPQAIASGVFPGASGSYSATASNGTPFAINNADSNLAGGSKITIFVKGNAYIGHNISYAADTADNATKFALVVLGNIYIDPGVTHLDGLYIAEPATSNVNADDGALWTCHPNDNSNPLTSDYILANCGSKLTINGAVVAKQVNLLRTPGDVGSASGSEDSLGGANASNNISEIINFTPEMIVGGPFFNSNTSTNLKIQSLISLPPVF